jgi:formylmethanofuran dehydrogenase subunit D
MTYKKNRDLKVVEQSGYHYKPTPTITLKGQWLKELGFEIGDKVNVQCKNNKIVIIKKEDI